MLGTLSAGSNTYHSIIYLHLWSSQGKKNTNLAEKDLQGPLQSGTLEYSGSSTRTGTVFAYHGIQNKQWALSKYMVNEVGMN